MPTPPVTLNTLAARVTALETDLAALRAQLVKGDELRSRLGALEAFAELNREALRAIFTVFHPIAEHDDPEQMAVDRARASAEAVHGLLMEWIDKLGGRLPLPGAGEGVTNA